MYGANTKIKNNEEKNPFDMTYTYSNLEYKYKTQELLENASKICLKFKENNIKDIKLRRESLSLNSSLNVS